MSFQVSVSFKTINFYLDLSNEGIITILKDDREKLYIENIKIPSYPSITGICFSK